MLTPAHAKDLSDAGFLPYQVEALKAACAAAAGKGLSADKIVGFVKANSHHLDFVLDLFGIAKPVPPA
jgi:hypothetical protein